MTMTERREETKYKDKIEERGKINYEIEERGNTMTREREERQNTMTRERGERKE